MIEELRKEIDTIDTHILELIHKRIMIMQQIGEEKKRLGKPIRDEQREKEKLKQVATKASALNIPTILVKNIWKLFFETSEEVEK